MKEGEDGWRAASSGIWVADTEQGESLMPSSSSSSGSDLNRLVTFQALETLFISKHNPKVAFSKGLIFLWEILITWLHKNFLYLIVSEVEAHQNCHKNPFVQRIKFSYQNVTGRLYKCWNTLDLCTYLL